MPANAEPIMTASKIKPARTSETPDQSMVGRSFHILALPFLNVWKKHFKRLIPEVCVEVLESLDNAVITLLHWVVPISSCVIQGLKYAVTDPIH
jgi:hypothetical protein